MTKIVKARLVKREKWFHSRSRVNHSVKVPKGFEAWFYCGPSLNFGHPNDRNKRK